MPDPNSLEHTAPSPRNSDRKHIHAPWLLISRSDNGKHESHWADERAENAKGRSRLRDGLQLGAGAAKRQSTRKGRSYQKAEHASGQRAPREWARFETEHAKRQKRQEDTAAQKRWAWKHLSMPPSPSQLIRLTARRPRQYRLKRPKRGTSRVPAPVTVGSMPTAPSYRITYRFRSHDLNQRCGHPRG